MIFLLYYFLIEIIPIWIHCFDKFYFPFTVPIFELFLSFYCRFDIITVFIIYEFFTIIFCCETFFINDLSVFWDSLYEVRSDSDIEYSIFLVRGNVNVSRIHIFIFRSFRIYFGIFLFGWNIDWRSWIKFRMTETVILIWVHWFLIEILPLEILLIQYLL